MKYFIFFITFLFISCQTGGVKNRNSEKNSIYGKASWYGEKFHGKKTASGEIYSINKNTAAHKTLPFGVILKVTNLKNNKSVVVKVNDRGPYVRNRVIDLSKSAFKKISSLNSGVIDVKIEILDDSKTFKYKN
ncbi:septal ring lytic transglycosylase RlpA family protein [bacterium]|nr:septal ring lytic transglycosylase RlpA family protein [bacterium]